MRTYSVESAQDQRLEFESQPNASIAYDEVNLPLDLTKYQTIVFDGHGVVTDSNITQIDSYFRTAKKMGGTNEQAQALVDYHVKFGGISMYPKFKWYVEEILQQKAIPLILQEFIDAFSIAVKKGMLTCRVADGLHQLRKETSSARWVLVSEGNQEEIRTLFDQRGLTLLFDGGIFGSPDNKKTILAREKAAGNIKMPALFIGDCKYDYEAATHAGLDFIFLSEWTDVADWEHFCIENKIQTYPSIQSL